MSEQLARVLDRRRAKAKQLHETAEAVVLKHYLGGITQRQFIVTIYEENTEYVAALEMLAEIDLWFHVEPVRKPDDGTTNDADDYRALREADD